jgi:hypothetical protein
MVAINVELLTGGEAVRDGAPLDDAVSSSGLRMATHLGNEEWVLVVDSGGNGWLRRWLAAQRCDRSMARVRGSSELEGDGGVRRRSERGLPLVLPMHEDVAHAEATDGSNKRAESGDRQLLSYSDAPTWAVTRCARS